MRRLLPDSGFSVYGPGFSDAKASGVPHGGARPFHHKSTCLHAIDFRAKFGHVTPENLQPLEECLHQVRRLLPDSGFSI